ncbi:MAG: hypothetical protein ABGX05_01090, partial [Pirellulaceae bacterium]
GLPANSRTRHEQSAKTIVKSAHSSAPYGWLYGQSGHVWVEVLTSEGWRAVDPTAGMGCDSRYIPLFTSENGAVDFVYTSMPRIKVVEGR